MTKPTRAGSKLDQLLARSPTAALSGSSGDPDARYFRGGTITDVVTPPAYTITARVLHWITAFLILSMIPLGVVIANEWGTLVVQDPFRMGYDGVKTALAASNERVPANVDTGANLVTKANMNSARSQELLNPKIR